MRAVDKILFDLDGTISNPLLGITNSFNYALQAHGFEPVSSSQMAQYIGPQIDGIFRIVTGISNDAEILRLVQKYRERYSDIGYSENTLYPGIADALQLISDAKVPMAVCTSKRADFADRILVMFGLRHHFEFVDGGDVGIHKWQQIAALHKARMVSPSTVMVGDRAVDLVAAHRNRLKAAGVLWGFGSAEELQAENPKYCFAEPANLEQLLD
jgi:phosphoglycolate phosphatase